MATERFYYRKAASKLEDLSDKYADLAKSEDDYDKGEIHWIWSAAMRAAASHLRQTSLHRAQDRSDELTQIEAALEKQRE